MFRVVRIVASFPGRNDLSVKALPHVDTRPQFRVAGNLYYAYFTYFVERHLYPPRNTAALAAAVDPAGGTDTGFSVNAGPDVLVSCLRHSYAEPFRENQIVPGRV